MSDKADMGTHHVEVVAGYVDTIARQEVFAQRVEAVYAKLNKLALDTGMVIVNVTQGLTMTGLSSGREMFPYAFMTITANWVSRTAISEMQMRDLIQSGIPKRNS